MPAQWGLLTVQNYWRSNLFEKGKIRYAFQIKSYRLFRSSTYSTIYLDDEARKLSLTYRGSRRGKDN